MSGIYHQCHLRDALFQIRVRTASADMKKQSCPILLDAVGFLLHMNHPDIKELVAHLSELPMPAASAFARTLCLAGRLDPSPGGELRCSTRTWTHSFCQQHCLLPMVLHDVLLTVVAKTGCLLGGGPLLTELDCVTSTGRRHHTFSSDSGTL